MYEIGDSVVYVIPKTNRIQRCHIVDIQDEVVNVEYKTKRLGKIHRRTVPRQNIYYSECKHKSSHWIRNVILLLLGLLIFYEIYTCYNYHQEKYVLCNSLTFPYSMLAECKAPSPWIVKKTV